MSLLDKWYKHSNSMMEATTQTINSALTKRMEFRKWMEMAWMDNCRVHKNCWWRISWKWPVSLSRWMSTWNWQQKIKNHTVADFSYKTQNSVMMRAWKRFSRLGQTEGLSYLCLMYVQEWHPLMTSQRQRQFCIKFWKQPWLIVYLVFILVSSSQNPIF